MSNQLQIRFLTAGTAAIILAALGTVSPTGAIEKIPDEKQRLKTCERALCKMILLKEKSGPNLNCDLSKTWLKSAIKKGGKSKISWGFGDAQCATNVTIARKAIIAALTLKKATVMLPRQKATCKVERGGEIKTVNAVLSPKLKLKHGRAKKVWINLKELDGPADIKGTVWAAASLADSFGLFHRSMIKGINKFAHTKCRQRYGETFGLPPRKAPEKVKK